MGRQIKPLVVALLIWLLVCSFVGIFMYIQDNLQALVLLALDHLG